MNLPTELIVKRIARRLLLLVVTLTILIGVLNAGGAILNNELALTQMENSDLLFILKEVYFNAVRPIVEVIIAAVSVYFIGFTIYDTYLIIKNRKETN